MAILRRADFQFMTARAICLVTSVFFVFAIERSPAKGESFPVVIMVHVDKPIGKWKPV